MEYSFLIVMRKILILKINTIQGFGQLGIYRILFIEWINICYNLKSFFSYAATVIDVSPQSECSDVIVY